MSWCAPDAKRRMRRARSDRKSLRSRSTKHADPEAPPTPPAEPTNPPPSTAGPGGRGHDYIPVATRRAVRERDGESCSFVDERGVRCHSTWRLEFHHVVSPRLGGDNSPANVRIHCRLHNAWQARAELGDERFAKARDRDLQARRKKAPPG